MRISVILLFMACSAIACTNTKTKTRKALVQDYRGDLSVADVDPMFHVGEDVRLSGDWFTSRIIRFEDTPVLHIELPEEIQAASTNPDSPDLFVGYLKGDTLQLGYYHPKK